MLRGLGNQLTEAQEDLEAEKESRTKAENLKRDLNEIPEASNNQLLDLKKMEELNFLRQNLEEILLPSTQSEQTASVAQEIQTPELVSVQFLPLGYTS
ncbi:hypothetical protein TNCV_4321861 [Trichonephila clavipes]|uniref:Uncharacterized protein n=1 Tax=Trichonephila clavipes TaxID=2585209 RepID=A0A8X6SHY1_TRICX|nr:hypothetical protein TNCV_4321861 [Trichonephila clavipes]